MKIPKYKIHEENREKIDEIVKEVSKYYRIVSYLSVIERVIDITIENLKKKNEPDQTA